MEKAWVIKAKKLHEGIYDFSNSIFSGQKNIVSVICLKHGEFETKGYSLLNKDCCPTCIKENYKKRAIKSKQTCLKKYGVSNVMQVDKYKEKLIKSVEQTYGVNNVRKLSQTVDKARKTNLERYGEISYIKSSEGKKQIADTMEKKYGARNFTHTREFYDKLADIKEKSKQTQILKYGAEHYSKSEEFKKHLKERKAKEIDTKKKNGTLNSSVAEEHVYEILCLLFGEDDVKKEYVSDRYPFHCDFYIVSEDLYIEINAHQSHGGRPFIPGVDEFSIQYQKLLKESEYSDWSKQMLYVWSDLDLRKRTIAKENGLNYLIFWDVDCRDFDVWCAAGCPIGQDYDVMYSWLPERDFVVEPDMEKLPLSAQATTKLAKALQFNVFYEKEIAMWYDKSIFRSNLPLQMYLYHNRLKHVGKSVIDLTDKQILYGFGASGVKRAYTSFDNSAMVQFLEKYNIESVYDPFAGWGERMITCLARGIKYTGVDIRGSLKPGYDLLLNTFGDNGKFIVADSTKYDAWEKTDAVVTCPPYYNFEIYSDMGLENENPLDFNLKIRDCFEIIRGKGVRFCAIQTNQRCKPLFMQTLIGLGYSYVEQMDLNMKSSHLTKGRKSEFESLLVFELKGK